jgi:hypothetical protein
MRSLDRKRAAHAVTINVIGNIGNDTIGLRARSAGM